MQRVCFCLLAAASLHSLTGSAWAQPVDRVVHTALERHPRIAELREAAAAAEAEVGIPAANWNPRLSLEGSIGSQHTRDLGSSRVISPALRVRKLLHDAGRTDLEVRQREARLLGARSTLQSAREDMALQVVTAYLQLARADDSLQANRLWLKGLGGIAAMTDAIQRIDPGRQFDHALALSRVQRADAELLVRSSTSADAAQALRGLVGADTQVVRPITPLALPGKIETDDILQTHPQLKAAQAAVDAAREQSLLDQLHDRPVLSVEAYAASGQDYYGRFKPVNNLGIQLVGNLSLFDGGAGAATSNASKHRLLQAEQALETSRTEIRTALARLEVLLADSQARNENFELAYRQAVDLADRMREQFRAGRRPLIDLLSQETEIYQTRLSRLGEQYDALLTQARMAHASGRLLAVLGIDNTDPSAH